MACQACFIKASIVRKVNYKLRFVLKYKKQAWHAPLTSQLQVVSIRAVTVTSSACNSGCVLSMHLRQRALCVRLFLIGENAVALRGPRSSKTG